MTSSVDSGAGDTVPDGGGTGPTRGGPDPTAAQEEANRYVAAVRASFADLPPTVRDELVEDLPEHLTEVLAEGGGPLETRLGPPEVYAAELRSAAGAAAARPGAPAPTAPFAEVGRQLRSRLRTMDSRLGPVLGYPRASDFLGLLVPAWWVLRGYLAAMFVVVLLEGGGSTPGLLPRLGDSSLAGLMILTAFVLGSIWLGRRSDRLAPWPRFAMHAGTLLLVLVGLTGFATADSRVRGSDYSRVFYDNDRYGHVRDVFGYDQHGRLLQNVRLFDQDGQPIHLGDSMCSREAGQLPMPPGSGYPYCPELAPFGPQPPGAPASPDATVQPRPTVSGSGGASGPAPDPVPQPTTSRPGAAPPTAGAAPPTAGAATPTAGAAPSGGPTR